MTNNCVLHGWNRIVQKRVLRLEFLEGFAAEVLCVNHDSLGSLFIVDHTLRWDDEDGYVGFDIINDDVGFTSSMLWLHLITQMIIDFCDRVIMMTERSVASIKLKPQVKVKGGKKFQKSKTTTDSDSKELAERTRQHQNCIEH